MSVGSQEHARSVFEISNPIHMVFSVHSGHSLGGRRTCLTDLWSSRGNGLRQGVQQAGAGAGLSSGFHPQTNGQTKCVPGSRVDVPMLGLP